MSLVDELKDLKPRRCAVCEWISTLETTDQEALAEYVREHLARGPRGWQPALHRVCARNGLECKVWVFRHHIQNHQ